MGTLKQELEYGCLSRAMDDEPLFVLMARDAAAPTHIRVWAQVREQQIKDGEKPETDLALVQEALECADKMEAWRREKDGAWRTGLFGDRAAEPGK